MGKGSSQDNGKRKKVKGKRQNDDKLKQNLYPLTLILGPKGKTTTSSNKTFIL
jgi:hypothetical protein